MPASPGRMINKKNFEFFLTARIVVYNAHIHRLTLGISESPIPANRITKGNVAKNKLPRKLSNGSNFILKNRYNPIALNTKKEAST
jgi:hypothetical protein